MLIVALIVQQLALPRLYLETVGTQGSVTTIELKLSGGVSGVRNLHLVNPIITITDRNIAWFTANNDGTFFQWNPALALQRIDDAVMAGNIITRGIYVNTTRLVCAAQFDVPGGFNVSAGQIVTLGSFRLRRRAEGQIRAVPHVSSEPEDAENDSLVDSVVMTQDYGMVPLAFGGVTIE